jgi:hypothetical protein
MAICFLFASVIPTKAGDTHRHIEQPVRESINTRQATQKAEEQWRLEREKMVARFEQLQKEQEQLQYQKTELYRQAELTRPRLVAKEKQLADIEQISSRIRPFLDELVNELKFRVAEGLPFLTSERQRRIHKLESIMADPEITLSEKYRKVMEALLVEAEYGFTIEVYQETITVEDQPMLVDIFRLGRLSLFYQSLDQKHCGFYNVAKGRWQSLHPSQNQEMRTAIEIGTKRRPVELLALPIGRMVAR